MSDDNIDYRLLNRIKDQKRASDLKDPLKELLGSEHLYSFLRLVEILRCVGDRVSIDITPEEVSFTLTNLDALHDLDNVMREITTEITTSFDFCEKLDNPQDYKQMFHEGVNDAYDAIKSLVVRKGGKDDDK